MLESAARDRAPTERIDARKRAAKRVCHTYAAIVILVERTVLQRCVARDREHSAELNRTIEVVHARESKGIATANRTRRSLQVNATGRSRRAVELHDHCMVGVHELHCQRLSASAGQRWIVRDQCESSLPRGGTD